MIWIRRWSRILKKEWRRCKKFTKDLEELGFPGGSVGKMSAYHAGDLGSIPGSGRSFGEGNGNPLQYSLPGKSMDVGAWWATVHGVAKSRTRLCNFTFTFISQSESSKLRLAYLTRFPLLIVWPGLFVGWTSLPLWCDRRNSDVLHCFQTLPT